MRRSANRAQAPRLVELEALAEQPTGATMCAHAGCSRRVHLDETKRPDKGWAVVYIRRYAERSSKTGVVYVCPDHAVAAVERQTRLAV